MGEVSRCKARQYSDQMMCGQCGLTWDMNDPEPPTCGEEARRQHQENRAKTKAPKRLPFETWSHYMRRTGRWPA